MSTTERTNGNTGYTQIKKTLQTNINNYGYQTNNYFQTGGTSRHLGQISSPPTHSQMMYPYSEKLAPNLILQQQ